MRTRRDGVPLSPQEIFYESYTGTMMAFAGLEDGLASAFLAVFQDKAFLAQSLFYAQQGFAAKQTLVDAAYVPFAHGTVVYDVWVRIAKKLDKSRTARNQLAHGCQLGVFGEGMDVRYCVRTSPFSVVSRTKGKVFQLFVEDMDIIQTRAVDVRKDLEALAVVVSKILQPTYVEGILEPRHEDALKVLGLQDPLGLRLNASGCLEHTSIR
jgi:hypothetical protein